MTLYLYRVENIKTGETTYVEVFDRLEIGVVNGNKHDLYYLHSFKRLAESRKSPHTIGGTSA